MRPNDVANVLSPAKPGGVFFVLPPRCGPVSTWGVGLIDDAVARLDYCSSNPQTLDVLSVCHGRLGRQRNDRREVLSNARERRTEHRDGAIFVNHDSVVERRVLRDPDLDAAPRAGSQSTEHKGELSVGLGL